MFKSFGGTTSAPLDKTTVGNFKIVFIPKYIILILLVSIEIICALKYYTGNL